MFDAIFVPEGMEARAVNAAVRRARSSARVVTIGLGPKRARESVERALRTARIQRAVLAGVCGLLAPRYKAGDALVYADARTAAQADPLLTTDAQLSRMLAATLPHAAPLARALQWDCVVTTAREKSRLARLYEADAVDMESYAVLSALHDAGVRATVLRIASDAANEDLPNLNAAIGRNGALDGRLLLREMLSAPRAGARMAWNGMAAINHLHRAIVRVARG